MFGEITKHKKHALVIFAVMTVLCLVKLGCAITFESEPDQCSARTACRRRFQSGRQGVAAGRRCEPPVGCIHDMHQQRIREFDALQPESADRTDSSGRHVVQYHLRRYRRRFPRLIHLYHYRRLHLRYDGGTDSGISRQEGETREENMRSRHS